MTPFCVIAILMTQYAESAFLTANIPEDGRLNFTELAKKYGHGNTTEHDVTTNDGYVLKMFNVPGNKSYPVLIVHGILGSSDDFLLRGNASLIVHLANAGYDVWAGNVRGNRYSRRHLEYNPDVDDAFWDYGLDEFALEDLPAMIDYVLNRTGHKDLAAIGFSEGTTMFFALGADKPEYNNKIKILISLAPVCYLHLLEDPLLSISKFGDVLNVALKTVGIEEFQGYNSNAKKFEDILCTQGVIGYFICMVQGFFFVSGDDAEELEVEFQPVIQRHLPAGTSRKNLYHLTQISTRRKFAKYDYGLVQNWVNYGSVSPPVYGLSKVTMKVALVAGANDRVATVESVKTLRDQLPNVVRFEVLEPKKWNHFDFPFARNADKKLFPLVFEILNEYAPLN